MPKDRQIPEMFRNAKQNRVYQDIVEQIQNAILSGELKVGDMLPAERELKEVFKTSRGTLREALRVLEQKGLIEIRVGVGGGAVVKDATAQNMSETLAFLIRFQKVSLEDLAEFREGLESLVMELAAKRSKPKHIAKLNKLLKAADKYVKAGPERWNDFVEVDKKIHNAMAEISGNPIYIFIFRTIHDNIHMYYEQFLPGNEKVMLENYRDLAEMIDAVAEHDAKKAKRLARVHIHRFYKYMEQNQKLIS